MSNSEPDKKRRAAPAQIEQYGVNKRKLWHEYAHVKERLLYLCNFSFGGDYHEMALAVGVCYRQLYRILFGHSRLSVRLAGQVTARLGVRAEWLLCGTGPIFLKRYDDVVYVPRRPQSVYPIVDSLHGVAAGAYQLPAVLPDTEEPVEITTQFEVAASNLFQARANQKPVWFFLDDSYLTSAAAFAWRRFFTEKYVDVLSVTIPVIMRDMAHAGCRDIDINQLALVAASAGAGYGETLCAAAYAPPADRSCSILCAAFDAGLVTLTHPEIGVVPNHAQPVSNPIELGAAIGSAAYVDFLALTAQLTTFFAGGVVVAAGDPQRIVNMLLTQKQAHANNDASFSCAFFHDEVPTITQTITQLGGRVTYLPQPTTAAIDALFQKCHDAYAGKILKP